MDSPFISLCFFEFVCQILAGNAFLASRQIFWRSLKYQAATFVSAIGAEVDDPVGTLDDLHIVLDNQYGMTSLDKRVKRVEQFLDVVEMQARRRFVKDK